MRKDLKGGIEVKYMLTYLVHCDMLSVQSFGSSYET